VTISRTSPTSSPGTLRLLQTVVKVAAEKNSTLVMPVPVELLRFFDRSAPAGDRRPAEDSVSLADFGDSVGGAARGGGRE
jgi:hypothetical protein